MRQEKQGRIEGMRFLGDPKNEPSLEKRILKELLRHFCHDVAFFTLQDILYAYPKTLEL